MADLYAIDVERLAAATTANFLRTFGLGEKKSVQITG
jgi:hypothetical protein